MSDKQKQELIKQIKKIRTPAVDLNNYTVYQLEYHLEKLRGGAYDRGIRPLKETEKQPIINEETEEENKPISILGFDALKNN